MSAAADPNSIPYAEFTRGLLHDRLLDAVGELLRDRAWSRVTIAEVAQRAGVSRQTVYNAFGSRQELARAYVGREADRFLTAVDAAVRDHASEPRTALAAALEIFLAAAGAHPLVRAITATDGGEELLPLVTTRGGPLIDRVTEHLTELLLGTWTVLRREDAAPVADALVRLAISYAALPAGGAADTARAVAQILGPRIDELLG
jgi:AcrR family transcriptional regulator